VTPESVSHIVERGTRMQLLALPEGELHGCESAGDSALPRGTNIHLKVLSLFRFVRRTATAGGPCWWLDGSTRPEAFFRIYVNLLHNILDTKPRCG
jgi:hypothetical protein